MEELKLALSKAGLSMHQAEKIAANVTLLLKTLTPEKCWQKLSKELLSPKLPFAVHLTLYKTIYPHWENLPAPAWLPDEKLSKLTNIAKLMLDRGFKNPLTDYPFFHQWSTTHYPAFWSKMLSSLNILFDVPYSQIVDLPKDAETPQWFVGAKLNIANSCFQPTKRKALALISQTEQGKIIKTTYDELDKLSNRIATSVGPHLKKGERAALIMPMTREAVALFLGLIKAGCVVVSIPDSFSAKEIETRLQITKTNLVFCQDQILRGGKILPLYEKILDCSSAKNIVLPAATTLTVQLRDQDFSWEEFLSKDVEADNFPSVSCEPRDYINILFSSGTSSTPKAIPWTQTTPIKCGSDAFLHHNLQPNDIFCWPTNLGWMMGPWLIFACLLNKATIALYPGSPASKGFGKFIHDAQVTHLGVVPTLVRNWRTTRCMEGLNWKTIKMFSSTGERSNIEDMLYLMSLAHYNPVIEYCGGTEVGGAYLTGTLVQPQAPAAFTTPALGLDLLLLDETGKPSEKGEVALIPPSIGLSTELLNQNHHQIYYANMPQARENTLLRRHGDQVEHYSNGFYRILGRVDDVMKLSGIKVSSAEIEHCLQSHPAVYDVAAIAVDLAQGGPTQLIVFTVLKQKVTIEPSQLKNELQEAIKEHLNPIFKIDEVIVVSALPRTASNKIMRRVLREAYQKKKALI